MSLPFHLLETDTDLTGTGPFVRKDNGYWTDTLSGKTSLVLAAWLTIAAIDIINYRFYDGPVSKVFHVNDADDRIMKAMNHYVEG